jgi:hypothetical protein
MFAMLLSILGMSWGNVIQDVRIFRSCIIPSHDLTSLDVTNVLYLLPMSNCMDCEKLSN